MYDVIIIGSGPAGLTAAIYTTRANLKTLVLAGQKWGGQLMLTSDVENYPGFPDGILGPDLMHKFRDQAERFKAEIVDKDVTKVMFSKHPFKVWVGEKEYQGKSVIVATGANTKWLGVAGEQELIGRGVSSCAPCDAFFFKDKKVIVVGGGDSAMEEALVLTKFASSVTIVHRRDEFRASKIMQDRVLKHPKIKVLWNSEVVEVIGKDKIEAVKIKSNINGQVSKVPIEGMFVAIGHIPNTKVFHDVGLELDEKGYIKRKEQYHNDSGLLKYWAATNIDGVFVAGDVHDYHYRQAVTAAGFGCMAAMDAERWLESSS